MEKSDKIYVAGHRGMVGSAILRKLEKDGYRNLVVRSSQELDLRDQLQVSTFFENEKPDYVFLAAAKVGGIIANDTSRAEFIYNNLMIQSNVIHCAYLNKVKKLLFLGSSCIYPKLCSQPMKEKYLLTGLIEPTNEPYAIAKIAGIKLCEAYRSSYGCNFISVMPTNIYGPNDNYDLNNSHVLPALIRKFVTAQRNKEPSVVICGSGRPKREFLHVEDLADALVFLMQKYNNASVINIGIGEEISILDLAKLIQSVVGYQGIIKTDSGKPDGSPGKLVDLSKINSMGWKAQITLEEGVRKMYEEVKDVQWLGE